MAGQSTYNILPFSNHSTTHTFCAGEREYTYTLLPSSSPTPSQSTVTHPQKAKIQNRSASISTKSIVITSIPYPQNSDLLPPNPQSLSLEPTLPPLSIPYPIYTPIPKLTTPTHRSLLKLGHKSLRLVISLELIFLCT